MPELLLALTLVLAFMLGVASAGAIYRAVLQYIQPERARGLTADAMREPAHGPGAAPILALTLVRLLLRFAFSRGSRA